MPLPEGYLPREGDVLILHGVVAHTMRREDSENVFVKLEGRHSSVMVDLASIVGIKQRHWEPGDIVRKIADPAVSGTIVAVCDGWVWMKNNGDEAMYTFAGYEIENDRRGDPVDQPFVVEPLLPQPEEQPDPGFPNRTKGTPK